MSSSFTDGMTAVQPLVVTDWDTSRTSNTVIQTVAGGGVDAWLQPATPRAGTLTAVFLAMADALALEALLSAGVVLTFADSDAPALGMTFVATGSIRTTHGDDPIPLGDGSETFAWSVSFGFQEVTP